MNIALSIMYLVPCMHRLVIIEVFSRRRLGSWKQPPVQMDSSSATTLLLGPSCTSRRTPCSPSPAPSTQWM
uniref:Uncharacterized protein n=1 Tax=Arundo donax TaxID=35708 RepID=A0A0A9G813_ARUDO